MNNLKTLDETLDFLNNKNTESTNESVLGAITGVLIAPYLFVALCALILGLISSIKNAKYKNMIFKNPEVTSSIKVFGKRLQEQIKKSMSKHSRYFKTVGINVDSKNISKEKVTVTEDEARKSTIYRVVFATTKTDKEGKTTQMSAKEKELKEQAKAISAELKPLREDLRMAKRIEEKYPQLQQLLETERDMETRVRTRERERGYER